ncbi:MAG: hypothetical protein SOW59_08135 [Corynebacterium sp.]|nr:hypothetical protein [Corynebacterium sp.]
MNDDNQRPGPIDYNRRRKAPPVGGQQLPRALRWAYWLFIAVSICMVCAGLVGIFGLGVQPEIAQPGPVRFNTLLVAWTNIVLAVVFSLFAPQVPSGSRFVRRLITGAVIVALFMNIAAFLIGIAGLVLIVIPVLLALCLLFMYRPEVNDFLAQQSGQPRWDN